MLKFEDLYSAGAFASSIVTGNIVPGGAVGQAVTDGVLRFASNIVGPDALEQIVDTFDVVEGSLGGLQGGAAIAGLVAAVVKTISRIRPSVESAKGVTKYYFNTARSRLMGGVAGTGRVPLRYFPGVGVDHWAAYLFKRAFIVDKLAKDHAAGYPDPWGTLAYTDYMRGNLLGGDDYLNTVTPLLRPYGELYSARGWSWPDSCVDWVLLQLDTGSGDCPWPPDDAVSIVWPWAWPLASPVRVQGTFTKAAEAPAEQVAAGVFSLPTRQHVMTLESDVAESERYIRRALGLQYPGAYQDAGGAVRWPGPVPNTYWLGVPPPSLEAYSQALQRITGWRRTRLALRVIRQNPAEFARLPADVRQWMVGPDWD